MSINTIYLSLLSVSCVLKEENNSFHCNLIGSVSELLDVFVGVCLRGCVRACVK